MAQQKYATMPTEAYINLKKKGFRLNKLDDLSPEFQKKARQLPTRPLYKKILTWLSQHVLGMGQQKLDPAVFGHARLWPKEKARAMKIQKIHGFIRSIWDYPNQQTHLQLPFEQGTKEVKIIQQLAPDLLIVATGDNVGIYCDKNNFLWFHGFPGLIDNQSIKDIKRLIGVDEGKEFEKHNKALIALEEQYKDDKDTLQKLKKQQQNKFFIRLGIAPIQVSSTTRFPPLSHLKFYVMEMTMDYDGRYGSKIDHIYKRIIKFSKSVLSD